jgi:dTDP-4-amino-4,6-dideoxygalactose transaminase
MIPLIHTNGQQTNFGPWFWALVNQQRAVTGRHVLPVTNGTVALTIAAQTEFQRRTNIAVPDYTMVATLHAIVAAGCDPIIVPCDPDTGMMNVDHLARLVAWGKVQGAVVVSPFGASFDPAPYEALGIRLVYDLAGAWPMKVETAHPIVYSAHATKNISTAEGGFISYSTEGEWEAGRRLSCFDLDPMRQSHTIYAWNGKMDEMRCRNLCFQLDPTTEWHREIMERIEHKRTLVGAYAEALPMIQPLANLVTGCPTLCVFNVPDADKLEKAGTAASIIFKRYYHPLLSDMQFQQHVTRETPPNPKLRQYIAFPSDVDHNERQQVINFVKGVFHEQQ